MAKLSKEKPIKDKIGAKKSTKKLGVKKQINTNKENIIIRDGYTINFVKPDNEKLKNNLINTGKVVDMVAISVSTANDKVDEIVVFIRN